MNATEIISGLGIAAVPVITVIVFLVCEAVKATPLDEKWLPVVAGFSGGTLGIAATFLMEDFTGKDPLTAVAVGIVSGLAATGAHQIYKQMTKAEAGGAVVFAEPAEYEGKHEAGKPEK